MRGRLRSGPVRSDFRRCIMMLYRLDEPRHGPVRHQQIVVTARGDEYTDKAQHGRLCQQDEQRPDCRGHPAWRGLAEYLEHKGQHYQEDMHKTARPTDNRIMRVSTLSTNTDTERRPWAVSDTRFIFDAP